MSSIKAPNLTSASSEDARSLLDTMTELSTKALYALERADLEGMLEALSDRDAVIAELGPLFGILGSPEPHQDLGRGAFVAELTLASRKLEDADAMLQSAIEKRRDEVSLEIDQLKAKSGRERQFLRQAGSSHTLNTRG